MDDLHDIEAIRQLKARYFRLMDTKSWEAFADVFVESGLVTDTTAAGGIRQEGTNVEFVTYLSATLDGVVTVHHGHMPEIAITSPTTAEGIWAMEDLVRWPGGRELRGYGHYHETYSKSDGQWRIATMRLTRLHQEMTSPPNPATPPTPGPSTRS